MVHLAGLAGLDDEPDAGAGLLLDQVVMDGADEQQGRDRGQLGRGVPVGEDDHLGAVRDGRAHPGADVVEGLLRAPRPGWRRPGREQPVDGERPPARLGRRPR